MVLQAFLPLDIQVILEYQVSVALAGTGVSADLVVTLVIAVVVVSLDIQVLAALAEFQGSVEFLGSLVLAVTLVLVEQLVLPRLALAVTLVSLVSVV